METGNKTVRRDSPNLPLSSQLIPLEGHKNKGEVSLLAREVRSKCTLGTLNVYCLRWNREIGRTSESVSIPLIVFLWILSKLRVVSDWQILHNEVTYSVILPVFKGCECGPCCWKKCSSFRWNRLVMWGVQELLKAYSFVKQFYQSGSSIALLEQHF